MVPINLVKKTISFDYQGKSLQFLASQSLFSSFSVDLGSQLLLKTLIDLPLSGTKSILDLGCGYGILGIALKGVHPNCTVTLIDRDNLAVDFTTANAKLNNVEAKAQWSLGYDELPKGTYDLIISNIPAKAGEKVIESLLLDATHFLQPKGIVATVVINRLVEFIKPILIESNGIKVILERANNSYTVFHYQFNTPPVGPFVTAFDRGIYTRGQEKFVHKELRYFLTTNLGVSEFNELDYETQLIFDQLLRLKEWKIENLATVNVGQGHIPFIASKVFIPKEVYLLDRDLLALKATSQNIRTLNSDLTLLLVDTFSQITTPIDLIVMKLNEVDGREAISAQVNEAVEKLSLKGKLIVAGTSTAISRIVDDNPLLKEEKRAKYRGSSVSVFKSLNTVQH